MSLLKTPADYEEGGNENGRTRKEAPIDTNANEGNIYSERDGSHCSESESDGEDEDSLQNELAVGGLEDLALSFVTQLADAIAPEMSSKENDSQKTLTAGRSKRRIVLELADRSSAKCDARKPVRQVQFPRGSVNPSARSMAQLFRVIDVAHDASTNCSALTKRDIYYRDVSIFRTQNVVNQVRLLPPVILPLFTPKHPIKLVDDIAATLSLSRADLGIRASPKGLFCGAGLTIHFLSGGSVGGHDTEASLIPLAEDIAHFEIKADIAWILIVEKEAVFQTLCSASITSHPSLPGPGILLTGKGYPDVATRQIVKSFSDNMPEKVPIVVLVDADAYGLDIASVYKFGSIAMKHENDTLAAHRVEWMGVSFSEVLRMGIGRDNLLPITEHDHRKALAMLRSDRYIPGKWRRELMQMLHTRKKAEIEVISSLSPVKKKIVDESTDFVRKKQKVSSFCPLVEYVKSSINRILSESA